MNQDTVFTVVFVLVFLSFVNGAKLCGCGNIKQRNPKPLLLLTVGLVLASVFNELSGRRGQLIMTHLLRDACLSSFCQLQAS